jgi:hypothetical protein
METVWRAERNEGVRGREMKERKAAAREAMGEIVGT